MSFSSFTSTLRLKTHSQLTQSPFTGTDCLFFMSSLCGVHVRVRVNDFSSKITGPRDMLFFLKDTLSIEDEKCSRHADLFVRLFARAITSEGAPTLSVKISTFYHNFLIDYCRDFSHILLICTRPQEDSLV